MRLLTLVLKLFLLLNVAQEPYAIAVPMAASMEVEQVAAQHNVRIVRVGNSHSAMMEATRDPEVRFVGGTRGGFIFPEFLFAADGMFSAAKLLEMLARSPYDLAELDLQLPRRFQQELLVPCPWGRKAAVLRRALEYPARERLLLDGVKLLLEDGSTVVLFPEQQTAHMVLITDADSEELARQHAQRFAELIQQWQQ
jgi:mannose-1-phosphate guanylyltransferase/phosphomannomutase